MLILLFLAFLITQHPDNVKASSKTIFVPDDYPTIQTAIDNASQGDTVFVRNGTYNENLVIEKPLSLIGEDSRGTTIVGVYVYYSRDTIIVSADDVSISGFTIIGSGSFGIHVENGGSNRQPIGCRIVNNNIMNASTGIIAYGMSNPTTGIRYPSDLVISENNITQNTDRGIYCSASNTTISGNSIKANGGEGIIVDECVNVTILQNNIMSNGRGLLLRWWGPFYVYGNNITDMSAGIVFGEFCSNATVYANNISRNGVGVELANVGDIDLIGKYNTVYYNNIVDNAQQVVVYPKSDVVAWDNGKIGNHWNDHSGHSAYVIDENNSDHYPLTQPVNISSSAPPNSNNHPLSSLPLPTIAIIAFFGILAVVAIAAAVYLKKHTRVGDT